MSQALEQAVQELKARSVPDGPLPRAENFKCTDDSFSFVVVKQDGSKVRVSCSLLSPDTFPSTACFLCCEDGGSNVSSEESLAIESLSASHFSKSTQLQEVVGKVLQVFSGSDHPGIGAGQAQQWTGKTAGSAPGQPGTTQDVHMTSVASAASDLMDIDTVQEDEDDVAGSMDAGGDYSYSNQGSDSDGYAHEEEDDDDDDDDREIMIECGKRQGRWERYETAWQQVKAQQEQGMSAEQAAVMKHQIFDSKEAFLRLSRELLEIIRLQSVYLFADSVADDVYHWAVELSGFEPSSGLGQDMLEVQRRYHYSSVQIRLHFMRDLHPFYPARVELVRPHFKHWAHGAVASHPLLQLNNWDPLRPQLTLIEQIKTFLQTHARVDLACPLNDISRYPTSSYSPVERYLAHLEALTGFSPLCVSGGEGGPSEAQQLYECRTTTTTTTTTSTAQPTDSGGAAPGRKRGRSARGEKEGAAAGTTTTTTTTTAAGAGATEPETYWARGTGYGHGSRSVEVWDNQASAAAQAAQDREMMRVMGALTRAVHRDLGPLPDYVTNTDRAAAAAAAGQQAPVGPAAAAAAAGGGEAAAGEAATSTSTRRTTRSRGRAPAAAQPAQDAPPPPLPPAQPPDAVDLLEQRMCVELVPAASEQEEQEEQGYEPDVQACQDAIAASCLVPLLAHELRVTSFSDMCDRQAYYTCLMRLLIQLCRPGCAASLLLRQLPGQSQGSTLAACIAQLRQPSQQFVKLTRAALIQKMREEETELTNTAAAAAAAGGGGAGAVGAAGAQQPAAGAGAGVGAAAPPDDTLNQLKGSMYLALLVHRLCLACEAAVAQGGDGAGAAGPGAGAVQTAGPSSGGAGSSKGVQDPAAEYEAVMRPLQVLMVEDLAASHHYSVQLSKEMSRPSDRVVRLGREIAGLSSDLALSPSSSVFVAVDESNMMIWRALITGPDDTPYSGGCFIFDFYFPPMYPQVAPQVNLRTTGGGSVRFNPNLYNCGKVCLSLLGTWQGGKGEGWLAGVSTANQVLLSIQSLIFVEQPYFNEPGFEKEMNSVRGKASSAGYNQIIREATVRYAMLDCLRHPKPEFADVIKNHFRLRRGYLVDQVGKWVSEASSSSKHANSMATLYADLKTELNKV